MNRGTSQPRPVSGFSERQPSVPMLRPFSSLALVILAVAPSLGNRAQARAQADAAPRSALFEEALNRAEDLLGRGGLVQARAHIDRALERDPRERKVWDLLARWAKADEDRDTEVYARYRELELARAQGLEGSDLRNLERAFVELDPKAVDLLALGEEFLEELDDVAAKYVKQGRPHSAIAVHKRILSLSPDRAESITAIETLAAAPDPSLAEDAKTKDLFEGITEEWMAEHDKEHADWGDRAQFDGNNYRTQTNAGYRVMVTAAEAMEQMNAFYRVFFNFVTGKSGGSVPRIELLIFKDRDEYLERGTGPPADWSGGQFTGGTVETFMGPGGFEGMTNTLFHEAAHQFVSLATQASGWLNEGLASFFEGCRIQPNGTVLVNLPANHRLYPLAIRMERGWMENAEDGIDPENPNVTPETSPTFRTVLENRYEWGPAWYSPTWGLVYFLYNFQDPLDGRFVYRASFRDFIDKSGGRTGDGAVSNFEEVVLGNPAKETPGLGESSSLELPETVEELDLVWKDYILSLRDEQSGLVEAQRPWADWAAYAIRRKEFVVAQEHFEKGLVAAPFDVDLLESFAEFLHEEQDNSDRASKLQLRAVQLLERAPEPDEKRIAKAEKRLASYDPEHRTLSELEGSMGSAVESLVRRYLAEDQPSMAMWLSWKLGTQLGSSTLFDLYSEGLAVRGSGLSLWELAYDEVGLRGWNPSDAVTWRPDNAVLTASNGPFAEDVFDFRFLTLDRVTGGNYSFEAEVLARRGQGSFCGLVFGQKNQITFHSLLLWPPRTKKSDIATETSFVDLSSFFSDNSNKVWRHLPVGTVSSDETFTDRFIKLRIDVVGGEVDAWVDDEYVASQKFQEPGVLSGKMGLIVGPGDYEFRNVRFLIRDPKDAAAKLERDARLAELASSGAGIAGSFTNLEAPFPDVQRWVGDPLEKWSDLGTVPKLLVLWSKDQNDAIPLEKWLGSLASTYADSGLEIVSVASANDSEGIEAYLEGHPFPGRVAVDRREGFGFGETFDQFSIERFNLPRLLLLDVNDEVIWEGDPGFTVGVPWTAGTASYLDTPLEELVRARRLPEVLPFAKSWTDEGRDLLLQGNFEAALPYLKSAQELADIRHPSLDEANGLLKTLEASIRGLGSTASSFERSETEPALQALMDLGASLGIETDKRTLRATKEVRRGERARAWDKSIAELADHIKDTDRGRAGPFEELLETWRGRPGPLVAELADTLEALAGEGPPGEAWSQAAEQIPRRWLISEYFRLAPH